MDEGTDANLKQHPIGSRKTGPARKVSNFDGIKQGSPNLMGGYHLNARRVGIFERIKWEVELWWTGVGTDAHLIIAAFFSVGI
jgi:hypothetical protein